MPLLQPHPITVTVNDDAGELLSGATVTIINTTKGTRLEDEETTDSGGIALIDLVNMPDPTPSGNRYDAGDKVLIVAYKGNQHDGVMYTVAGQEKSQTLNMNPVPFIGSKSSDGFIQIEGRMMQLLTANTNGSNPYYCKVWGSDGELFAHVETLSNTSQNIVFGRLGKQMGGFVLERENNALVVTVTMK